MFKFHSGCWKTTLRRASNGCTVTCASHQSAPLWSHTLMMHRSLRKRLPFEDEEFDYVHIDGLAFAVPENKVILYQLRLLLFNSIWSSVIPVDLSVRGTSTYIPQHCQWVHTPLPQELRRVMRTGGIIEQVEEGMSALVLADDCATKWRALTTYVLPFTSPHAQTLSFRSSPGGSRSHCTRTSAGLERITRVLAAPRAFPRLRRHSSATTATRMTEKSHMNTHFWRACSTTSSRIGLSTEYRAVSRRGYLVHVLELTCCEACLPNYFTAIFGQAMIPPVLQFPMPPLAPMAPLPAELEGQAHVSARRRPHEQDELQRSVDSLLSTAQSETNVSASVPTTSSRTLDSIVSTEPTTHSARSSLDAPPSDRLGASLSSFDTSRSSPAPDNKSARKTTLRSQSPSIKSTRSTEGSNGSRPSLRSRDSGPHRDSYSLAHSSKERPSVPSGDLRTEDSTSLGGTHLFPMETILSLPERSLNMQLFRALGLVMSVKEAMWDELCERVGKAAEERRLREECGWEDADFAESALREKFEGWVERYRRWACPLLLTLMLWLTICGIAVMCGRGCPYGTAWSSAGGNTRGEILYREQRCWRKSGYGRTYWRLENTQKGRT